MSAHDAGGRTRAIREGHSDSSRSRTGHGGWTARGVGRSGGVETRGGAAGLRGAPPTIGLHVAAAEVLVELEARLVTDVTDATDVTGVTKVLVELDL